MPRQGRVQGTGNHLASGDRVLARSVANTDVVEKAWWTTRRRLSIANTSDPELYRYGVHAPEFWANLTVAPGTWYVRLKFAETRAVAPAQRAVTISINGAEMVKDMDIAATAGGFNKAVDLVFNAVQPQIGIM